MTFILEYSLSHGYMAYMREQELGALVDIAIDSGIGGGGGDTANANR